MQRKNPAACLIGLKRPAGMILIVFLLGFAGMAQARGFYPPVIYPTGAGPASLTAADYNFDGKTDIVVANRLSNNISVLIGNGDGTFQSAVNYPVGVAPVQVTNLCEAFDQSGLPTNLAVVNSGDNTVSVLVGNNDGTFQPAVSYPLGTGTNPQGVNGFADYNGDLNCDIAVANASGGVNGNGNVAVLFGNGDGTFQPAVNYDTGGSQPVALLPYQFDGQLGITEDLIVVNLASNNISILLNNKDGTFKFDKTFSVGLAPTAITVGFNYITAWFAVSNSGSNDITVFLQPLIDVHFAHIGTLEVGSIPVAVASGLLSPYIAVSRLSLVAANETANTITVWPASDRRPYLRAPSTFPTCSSPASVLLTDVNGVEHGHGGYGDLIVACTEGVGVMLNVIN